VLRGRGARLQNDERRETIDESDSDNDSDSDSGISKDYNRNVSFRLEKLHPCGSDDHGERPHPHPSKIRPLHQP
jgi:hypothetical protein